MAGSAEGARRDDLPRESCPASPKGDVRHSSTLVATTGPASEKKAKGEKEQRERKGRKERRLRGSPTARRPRRRHWLAKAATSAAGPSRKATGQSTLGPALYSGVTPMRVWAEAAELLVPAEAAAILLTSGLGWDGHEEAARALQAELQATAEAAAESERKRRERAERKAAARAAKTARAEAEAAAKAAAEAKAAATTERQRRKGEKKQAAEQRRQARAAEREEIAGYWACGPPETAASDAPARTPEEAAGAAGVEPEPGPVASAPPAPPADAGEPTVAAEGLMPEGTPEPADPGPGAASAPAATGLMGGPTSSQPAGGEPAEREPAEGASPAPPTQPAEGVSPAPPTQPGDGTGDGGHSVGASSGRGGTDAGSPRLPNPFSYRTEPWLQVGSPGAGTSVTCSQDQGGEAAATAALQRSLDALPGSPVRLAYARGGLPVPRPSQMPGELATEQWAVQGNVVDEILAHAEHEGVHYAVVAWASSWLPVEMLGEGPALPAYQQRLAQAGDATDLVAIAARQKTVEWEGQAPRWRLATAQSQRQSMRTRSASRARDGAEAPVPPAPSQ
eukprot:scaffold11.g4015.t1